MTNGSIFKNPRYREHAKKYEMMGHTTLRKTGLEGVLRIANARNLSVIEGRMSAREFREFKEENTSPEAIWGKVCEMGLQNESGAKRVIGMSLGNPSAYPDFPPHMRPWECLEQIRQSGEKSLREMAGYTSSFGYPPLLRKLKRFGFSDPESIHNDAERFEDVRVYTTAGGSGASLIAMEIAVLEPKKDKVVVPDWTYIIHLGAAYKHEAGLVSYKCRKDGRPDSDSLRSALHVGTGEEDHQIQAVIFTTIGNPIGAAMSREDIVEHLHIIGDAGAKLGRPILAMIDVAYEAFRGDGIPLDPIKIALEEDIKTPIIVMDTVSKAYGLCGWRMGKLAVYWPGDAFPDAMEDFFLALENDILPTLGGVSNPEQMAFNRFLNELAADPATMEGTKAFFGARRVRVSENLIRMAEALREIPGVYLSKYYDHERGISGIDPDTLSSFYLMFGFDELLYLNASEGNQAKDFAEFALETAGIPVVNCVPSQSFLPLERRSSHHALIRVTGLTDADDTAAFLEAVEAYARHLSGKPVHPR
ncbi:MAG: pyridoxal phosphate-dependent aminotransferase [Candidatus Micrarchaeota archaeon]